MQIICPNCGSKSPIEAGSLVTQTRIVCARCAVEFAAELSDEQHAVPAAAADERGIELFHLAEVAPTFHGRPAHLTEVAGEDAATAELLRADEVSDAGQMSESLSAEEVAAVEPLKETLAADEVKPAEEIAAVVEAAPDEQDSSAAVVGETHEVLSLPEEAAVANEAANEEAAAEADQSNVLEDVFAAWSQSRESKAEDEATSTDSAAAAGDYVTTPLSPDYEAAAREEYSDAGLTEHPSAEVIEAPTKVTAASTDEPAEMVGDAGKDAAETAVETADGGHEPTQAAFADAAPHVAAAQSFDGYSLGVRLLRVSPLWLLVSGLSFISFVVFCNWFFVPSNLARADAPRPASLRNEATNRSLASVASVADTARPDSRNSGTSRATLPADAEVVNASATVEDAKPEPTAAPATPAPTAEPTPAPKAEQPKLAESVAAQSAPAGKFTVQVGSYNAPGEAEARAGSLKSAGQPARVVEIEIPKRGKWYRVYVGGFTSRGEAEAHGKSLRERGLAESYIATEAQ